MQLQGKEPQPRVRVEVVMWPFASNRLDLGCGRGGDIGKWRGANVRQVVALDLSAGQLNEARVRAGGRSRGQGRGRRPPGAQGPGRGRGTQITWKQCDMLEPALASSIQRDLVAAGAAAGADAVAAMFCMQYSFGSADAASQLLSQIGAMLRPGGVL